MAVATRSVPRFLPTLTEVVHPSEPIVVAPEPLPLVIDPQAIAARRQLELLDRPEEPTDTTAKPPPRIVVRVSEAWTAGAATPPTPGAFDAFDATFKKLVASAEAKAGVAAGEGAGDAACVGNTASEIMTTHRSCNKAWPAEGQREARREVMASGVSQGRCGLSPSTACRRV